MRTYATGDLKRDIRGLRPASAPTPSTEHPESEVRPEKLNHRYPQSILQEGFTPIPNSLLNKYNSLKMTSNEVLFVMHLMFYKRNTRNPYPSFAKIASKMGVSDHQVRSYARNLERKELISRINRDGKSNEFDLTPLFDKLGDLNEES